MDWNHRRNPVLYKRQRRGRVGTRVVAGVFVATAVAATVILPMRVVVAAAFVGDSRYQVDRQDQPRAQFEVASVRPNKSSELLIRIETEPGGRFLATNVPVRSLIRIAYNAADFQVIGGPGWIDRDRFDVIAKADHDLAPMSGPFEGPPELRPMLRALLAERFRLAVHSETRQLPMFTLVKDRPGKELGPRLTVSAVNCAALFAQRAPDADPPRCGIRGGFGSIVLEGSPIAQLASSLAGVIGRPVEDKTGLTGTFDLQLSWDPNVVPGANTAQLGVPERPPLFKALEEQAGLRLERSTGPVEVFVIDRVERPTEN